MALVVPDFSHFESIILPTLLTDFVHGKSMLVEQFQRHHPFTSSLPSRQVVNSLALHSSLFSPSLPWFARSFRVKHDNAFLYFSLRRCTCLSHIVSDSEVYASVLVSGSRSCLLTSARFRSCGVLQSIPLFFFPFFHLSFFSPFFHLFSPCVFLLLLFSTVFFPFFPFCSPSLLLPFHSFFFLFYIFFFPGFLSIFCLSFLFCFPFSPPLPPFSPVSSCSGRFAVATL